MQTIPLQSVPFQSVNVQVNNQAVTLNVRQLATGLFVDVFLGGSVDPLIAGVLALNLVVIVRDVYLGLVGDFAFVDSVGNSDGSFSDPDYTGLANRYLLTYFTPDELASFSIGGALS